jgi:CheY-like chemotaxis protein/HPt (histidine-containing phosphotransfer) domain-containing protein
MTAFKVTGGNYDEMMRVLQVELHDDATDRLSEMGRVMERMAADGPTDTGLSALRRQAHNMKGIGGSFGYPALSQIAHRMETYVSDLTSWTKETPGQLQKFIDRMAEMLDRSQQPTDEELAQIVRALPTHLVQNFSVKDISTHNVEVLLVTPTRALAKLLTQQIMACGFRVNAVNDPMDGLNSALRARPDMIITSQVMRTMTGLDLVRAVRAIASIERIPAAILTSQGSDRALFPGIPDDVAILRTGDSFADDFGKVIAQFGIG